MPSKAPSFQYYPKDWRADAVFTCSLAARGLWHELMNMMHAQERYGYLSHNGLPIPDEAISRYCGCNLQEYQTLLAELTRAGVPSRTSNGTIYSRRMVDDEKKRSDWRKRQQNHRDRVDVRHGDVTPMSRGSSSPSSSPKPKQDPPYPPTQTVGGQRRTRRLTQAQREAQVGGGPQVEAVERTPEEQAAYKKRMRLREDIRREWEQARARGELPAVDLTAYRQKRMLELGEIA